MNPLFNTMMFRPQFADHSWISDTMTFCPDAKLMMQNAALSLQLSGLHSMYFSTTPFTNMDFGTNLASIWNQAYQAANASMANSLGSYFSMPGFFPSFTQTPQVRQSKDPAPKSDLTDAQKTEFDAKQTEYNNFVSKYDDIDAETKKALGFDTAFENAKKAYEKADTPEKVAKCIEDLKAELTKLAEEKDVDELLAVLPRKKDSEEFLNELETKVEDLYDETSDFESKIYNLICNSDPVIKADNVIEEMNLRQGKSCLIDELTTRYHNRGGYFKENWDDDKYEKVIETLVDAIKIRSKTTAAASEETKVARQALNKAYNTYIKDMNEENRQVLVKSYVNLYNAVRKAEVDKADKENKKFVKTLPEAFQECYLGDGELKPDFRLPVQNDGFVLKKNPTETLGKTEEKKEEDKSKSAQKTPMAATVTNPESNPFSVVNVDGVTGADRIAANMPSAVVADLMEYRYEY